VDRAAREANTSRCLAELNVSAMCGRSLTGDARITGSAELTLLAAGGVAVGPQFDAKH
jgi:hypothetical protein